MKIFKRVTSGIMALALCSGCVGMTSLNVAAEVSTYLKGDVDGDGDVDNVDSAYLANFLHGVKGSANDQMSQRLDVDLSGFIDYHDQGIISNIIVNDSSPVYCNYETSNVSIPSQTSIQYRKYNAQTGSKIGSNYTLNPVSDISANSVIDSEMLSENSESSRSSWGDYSNKGIVGVNMQINGQWYAGTGFVIGTNKILTAAHCVFDTEFNYSANNLTVDVYENNSTTPNRYSAVSYHFPQEYYDAPDYTPDCDYAIITVDHDFPSSYFMKLGVARDSLKNNTRSSVYNNIYDNNGIERLCIYLTGRWLQMWTEEGYFINEIMTDDVCYYNPIGHGGQSGAPVYVETEDEDKTVFGIVSGGSEVLSVCKRIDTDILHFAYNNPNL